MLSKQKDGMETEVRKKLFTVQDYCRMARAGILRPEDRVELIDGEIIEMSPIDYRHAVCVSRMTTLLSFCASRVLIFTQRKDPFPAEEVLLTVEVSDASLSKDQTIKLPKYSEARISEYWVADLQNNILYIYRNPNGETYDTILTFHPGDSVSVLAFPDITFRVDELLSTDCEIPVDEL